MSGLLLLGDRAYSSWSLRGWLLFARFGLEVETRFVAFSGKDVGSQLQAFAPARTVPTWITPEGVAVSDSLAIAEELATRHPKAGHWPADPRARAVARTMAAEMHSGFGPLRSACPMNLRCSYADFAPDAEVEADLRRLEVIWDHARSTCGGAGPWLCGDYGAVDAFFAPVAARIAGYGLKVSKAAQDYVDAHLADPEFLAWRKLSLTDGPDLPWYARDFAQRPWPQP